MAIAYIGAAIVVVVLIVLAALLIGWIGFIDRLDSRLDMPVWLTLALTFAPIIIVIYLGIVVDISADLNA